uniref:Ty3 transposon capsid-like protein domain-containing protein n=1 Tax=Esox lucius TaxID=8010 RepID=A0AAY5JWB1_ESOLU
MESAGSDLLHQHGNMIASLGEAMTEMVQAMRRLEARLPPEQQPPILNPAEVPLPSSPPSQRRTIQLSLPQGFSGDAAQCSGFLLQLELYFTSLSPHPGDREKVSALVSCLRGKALDWANSIWSANGPELVHYEVFVGLFRAVFDHPPDVREVGERLVHLRQGTRSVQAFALEFRTLAAGSGWNNRALIDHFRCHLRSDVRRELACRDAMLTFDQLVDMAIRLDNLLATRGRTGNDQPPPVHPVAGPEPMEVGGAARRETVRSRECSFCVRKGHSASHCFQRERVERRKPDTTTPSQVSRPHTLSGLSAKHMTLLVAFPDFPTNSQCKALVDSGAAGNLMDSGYAQKLRIPLVPLSQPRSITGLDSKPLGTGLVEHVTVPITMTVQHAHTKHIEFHVIHSPAFPVVLGLPWLSGHNPTISWSQRVLTGWSQGCQERCLGVSVGATSVESPDSVSAVQIPPEYADLALVFSKTMASRLPPHRSGDYKPKGRCCAALLSCLSPVAGRNRSDGDLCGRIPAAGADPPFHLARLLKFLFCEEEGWGFASVH